MALRLEVVLAVLAVVWLGAVAYRRRAARLARPLHHEPAVDRSLIGGAARAWLVFTTPYCATCGPVIDRIGAFDPDAELVVVDVADRPDLARVHHVRTAPTVLLAGADGTVHARFIGAVDDAALSLAVTRV